MSGSGNPQIFQGTINRLRANIIIPGFPQLNVTASYLGKEGISISFQKSITTFIETMTGAVTSPDPYQLVEISVHLIRAQPLAAAYRTQYELSSLIGNISVITDTSTLPAYQFSNCAVQALHPLNFRGDADDFTLMFQGYYNINSFLWNLS